MSTAQISAAGTAPVAAKHPRDTRTWWRVLLAIAAPLPMLGLGASYLISQIPSDGPFKAMVVAVAAHHQSTLIAGAFGLLFLVALIPATIALAWCTRRSAPVLTAAGASISLLGFLAGLPLLPSDGSLALATADKHLNVNTIAALDKALWAQPVNQVVAILFLAGIVIGLPLLGIALWRSKVAPAWMAICLIAGGFTHPFIPGHIAEGIGLWFAAIGFTAVTRALLHMPNDEFDLPPTRQMKQA
jgi:hypothetical protein